MIELGGYVAKGNEYITVDHKILIEYAVLLHINSLIDMPICLLYLTTCSTIPTRVIRVSSPCP